MRSRLLLVALGATLTAIAYTVGQLLGKGLHNHFAH